MGLEQSPDLTPEMTVHERVHIMPLGYEEQRAYIAADRLRADRVILVAHHNNESYVSKVERELSNRGIESDVERCNIFDLYSSIGTIAEIIHQNRQEEVYVNIATGGKITAIAGMIACMVSDAEPYYVQAKNYDKNVPEGVAAIKSLPRYPMDAPTTEQVAILDRINKAQESEELPTKQDLIEYGEELNLPFIAEHDVEDKGKYRLLDNHVVGPLEEKEFITIEKAGREKVVKMTQLGKGTLRAFQYKLIDLDPENKRNDAIPAV